MALVFISYCRENQSRAESLEKELKLLGYEVWLDNHLHGGQDWWRRILEEIRKCDVFVYAIDSASLKSEACQLEFQYAFDLKKRILPVLISKDVSDDDLRPPLAGIHNVDDRQNSREGYQEFIRSLRALPPTEPLPDPLPEPPPAPLSYKARWQTLVEAQRLTFDEQAAFLVELAHGLEDAEKHETALTVLRDFRRRPDLFPGVIRVTELVLANAEPTWRHKLLSSLVKDISVKQVWMSLVGGVLIPIFLVLVARLPAPSLQSPDPTAPTKPTLLVLWPLWSPPATFLLCISIIWKKLASRGVYAKIGLIAVPSILGYMIAAFNMFTNWEFGLSGAAASLFIVIIVFWKETPTSPLPLKSACMSLAGGLGLLVVLCLLLRASSDVSPHLLYGLELGLASLFAIYALFKLGSTLLAVIIRSKTAAR